MDPFCGTRVLKNAKYLQSREVAFFSEIEPIDGFASIVSFEILARLDRIEPREVKIRQLADALSKRRPPRAGAEVSGPLFSGTLRFVRTTFLSGGISLAVPDPDFDVAMGYAGLAVAPLSAYASQYGPNKLAVASAPVPFSATVTGGRYNDSILSGWADQIAKANGFGADSCLVFLNPQGVVNSDADATQGVLGYHNISASGVPYAFVNVMGAGLTLDDRNDVYAVALSHEIAEMTVDPRADGRNPEVADGCAGNCAVDYRNYFDSSGSWLGASPTPGYRFFTDGVATPSSVAQCPAPKSSCCYPPPVVAQSG